VQPEKRNGALEVTIVGGGMITADQILPTIYHLQRTGAVGEIDVCAMNAEPLRALRSNAMLSEAFPDQEFVPHPDLAEPPDRKHPDLYREVLAGMRPRQAVIVAVPDPLHFEVLMAALAANQNVICVKPLVLTYAHSEEIRKTALAKGLFVGVEYHKRFDRRALMAKRQYARGDFGEFVIGEAKMIEPYYYRGSNFQNWFTVDQTDPFTYVGCHYVDLVWYITGLRPVELTVTGVKGRFPNGNEGYLWANGRVVYENGAILSVTDGLGYPDAGAGSNMQSLVMFCEGVRGTGMIAHEDQFRGATHCYLEGIGLSGSHYNNIHTDFFRLVPWDGPGLRPIGYGCESITANLEVIARMATETSALDEQSALARHQEIIREVDARGIIATPANSWINELVTEAARLSITHDGEPVRIIYGDHPHVELRFTGQTGPATEALHTVSQGETRV
jgi:D-galacturonate reductase